MSALLASPAPIPLSAAHLRRELEKTLAQRAPGAFTTHDRTLPELVTSGIAQVDALTGGLPRGSLTEICGAASSGRTSLLLTALAAATQRGETCALIDTSDALDPESAAAAGVDLARLLWVRCCAAPAHDAGQRSSGKSVSPIRSLASQSSLRSRLRGETIRIPTARDIGIWGYGDTEAMLRIAPQLAPRHDAPRKFGNAEERHRRLHPEPRNRQMLAAEPPSEKPPRRLRNAIYSRIEQALKAADLLLSGGGFGLVALDLADLPPEAARRVPLASWFRFRRAVEDTPAVLLLLAQQPLTQSCASLVLKLRQSAFSTQDSNVDSSAGVDSPAHAQLLTGLASDLQVARWPSLQRKPAASAAFETRAEWAG